MKLKAKEIGYRLLVRIIPKKKSSVIELLDEDKFQQATTIARVIGVGDDCSWRKYSNDKVTPFGVKVGDVITFNKYSYRDVEEDILINTDTWEYEVLSKDRLTKIINDEDVIAVYKS